jgi:flagellar protein FliL
MSKAEAPAAAVTPAAPAKKSKMRLLLIVGVVLAAGGGGGFWWMKQQQPVEAAEAGHETPEAAHEPSPGSLLPLETFTVNLADAGASRFLRVTIQLVLAGEGTSAELEHDPLMKTRIRSAVLELLTTQQAQTLVTPEGKAALKTDIAARVTEATKVEVSDVLFSDFVVQF